MNLLRPGILRQKTGDRSVGACERGGIRLGRRPPRGLRRIDGRNGKDIVWKQEFDAKSDPVIESINRFLRGLGGINGHPWASLWDFNAKWAPLTPQTVDLDGDGVPDLVWSTTAADHFRPAWVVAVSGKTGRVLWFALRPAQWKRNQGECQLLGPPIILPSSDGPRIVVTYRRMEETRLIEGRIEATRAIGVEVLSGRSGTSLWCSLLQRWKAGSPVCNAPCV